MWCNCAASCLKEPCHCCSATRRPLPPNLPKYIHSVCATVFASNRPTMSTDRLIVTDFNPLECKCNYSVTSNNMKSVHWPLMDGLLHLVQRGGNWAGPQPAQASPRCTKCNSSPSTPSEPITVLLYNDPLLCGFNVPIKGLIHQLPFHDALCASATMSIGMSAFHCRST